jgi:hypothetical protein
MLTVCNQEFISEHWLSTLQLNHMASFDMLWQRGQKAWFEPPNHRRGGWSGVSRTTLTMADASEVGVFIKLQENHFYRSWQHLFQKRPTFEREYRNIQLFRQHGIPTVEPIYFGCRQVDGKTRAILVTRELSGFHPLGDDQHVLVSGLKISQRKQLFQHLASTVRGMHAQGFQHNCLYPKHVFLSVRENGVPESCLIDLEKARKPLFSSHTTVKDLGALHRHTADCSKTDRLRFFLAYRQEQKLSPDSKKIIADITRAKRSDRQALLQTSDPAGLPAVEVSIGNPS